MILLLCRQGRRLSYQYEYEYWMPNPHRQTAPIQRSATRVHRVELTLDTAAVSYNCAVFSFVSGVILECIPFAIVPLHAGRGIDTRMSGNFVTTGKSINSTQ